MSATLAFVQVSRWYGMVLGVSEIDLALGPGVHGLLGVNGAGKSTLLKLAAGLIAPSLGRVSVFGEDPFRNPSVRRRIGFCPDVERFYERMTPRAWVAFMARLQGFGAREARRRATEALERVGMGAAMDKPLAACSKGMRQRVKLARCLCHEPDVLLLDEPLTGLDPVARIETAALVKELGRQGRTVVVSSHVLREVEEMTERIVLIHQGRLLAAGGIEEIRESCADRPHRVEIRCADPKALARAVLAMDGLGGIELRRDRVVVQVVQPHAFFSGLTAAGCEPGLGIETVRPLDADLEALFGYLVQR